MMPRDKSHKLVMDVPIMRRAYDFVNFVAVLTIACMPLATTSSFANEITVGPTGGGQRHGARSECGREEYSAVVGTKRK
jgi:hypothetical protein